MRAINYSELLDLNPYMSLDEAGSIPQYKLIATARPDGESTDSGHYTANRKSSEGTWNHLDDTKLYHHFESVI